MQITDLLNHPWINFYIRGVPERDPGFKRVIMRLTRGGMTVAAILALAGIALYIVSYAARGMSFTSSFGESRGVMLWDELVVMASSAAILIISRTRLAERYGRILVSLLATIISFAILAEDLAADNLTFSSAYLSLVLIVAVGTMPFRPVQTLMLGLVVSAGYVAVMAYPTFRGGLLESGVVYMVVLTVILCGVSGVLYTSRYRQYQALKELRRAQAQLVQSEKLASLGQLTAGIAHEIKNPLNFINNFAELNLEHVDTLKQLLDEQDGSDRREIEHVLEYLRVNAETICEQGRRADSIVNAMMLHARGTPGERRWTSVNDLVEEYVALAHYGLMARGPSATVRVERDYDENVGEVEVVAQDLARVIINLLNNALDAVQEKASRANGEYEPVVTVRTGRRGDEVLIRVADNGTGIPADVRPRIFDPFFTTKPAGTGTGLGLSISYDIIVQEHGGRMDVHSRPGEGTEFVIVLPAEPAAPPLRRKTITS